MSISSASSSTETPAETVFSFTSSRGAGVGELVGAVAFFAPAFGGLELAGLFLAGGRVYCTVALSSGSSGTGRGALLAATSGSGTVASVATPFTVD